MTAFKRGQVVLVVFPFTDLSSAKQRPALIVSADARNAKTQDVILVAITSQMPVVAGEDEFAVPTGELAQWGLPKPSWVKLSKIFCLHQSLIRKPLGALPPQTLAEALRRLQQQFAP